MPSNFISMRPALMEPLWHCHGTAWQLQGEKWATLLSDRAMSTAHANVPQFTHLGCAPWLLQPTHYADRLIWQSMHFVAHIAVRILSLALAIFNSQNSQPKQITTIQSRSVRTSSTEIIWVLGFHVWYCWCMSTFSLGMTYCQGMAPDYWCFSIWEMNTAAHIVRHKCTRDSATLYRLHRCIRSVFTDGFLFCQ